jgi:hypothetical protein
VGKLELNSTLSVESRGVGMDDLVEVYIYVAEQVKQRFKHKRIKKDFFQSFDKQKGSKTGWDL